MQMKRAIGYCRNSGCEDCNRGIFLLNHGPAFYCPRCRELGLVEHEKGSYTGTSDVFKEVRVEYNFDPNYKVYMATAIVRDESLWGRNNVYTLQSPLIKTEARALKVAESVLSNLNIMPSLGMGEGIPRTAEVVLSFDDSPEDFKRSVKEWASKLEKSALRC